MVSQLAQLVEVGKFAWQLWIDCLVCVMAWLYGQALRALYKHSQQQQFRVSLEQGNTSPNETIAYQ